MYYPYFRGKQYELVTVRESASLMAGAGFTPIIEPVREQTSGLTRALKALAEENAKCIVIVNPQIGDHRDDGNELISFISRNYDDYERLQVGYLLTESMRKDGVLQECKRLDSNRKLALIHAGFSDANGLSKQIDQELRNVSTNGNRSRVRR